MKAPLEGTCDDRFRPVRDRFAALLADGSETGAAVCVYLGAEPVVDLWGGWSDAARTVAWDRDTIVPTYSVTRGLVGLDDPVVSVWPEYGAAGKSATTVGHLLAHRAALPAFPRAPTRGRLGEAQAAGSSRGSAPRPGRGTSVETRGRCASARWPTRRELATWPSWGPTSGAAPRSRR